ncbi:hypothetical protein DFH09DRAFT_1194489 [Mycena vulgaris]|nr:hypothetical protein DFH09DRAFT_1194489 [Mycena vulgaris]
MASPLDECPLPPRTPHILLAMATTTMPPTTHALPHAQRLRLMRSTRKLGALLGETPLLVEPRAASPTTTFAPSHSRSASTMSAQTKRSGRMFAASHAVPRSSSLSAAPPAVHTVPHAHSLLAPPVGRPILFLRLPTAGGSATPAERTPLPSPLSPTFSIALNSPSTPPADASRRRKMAKLVRTLGENVPPELVFRDDSSSSSPFASASTVRGRRRASTLSVPESALEQHRRGAILRKDSAASLASLRRACNVGTPVRTAQEAPLSNAHVDEPFYAPSTVPYVPQGRASYETSASAASSDRALSLASDGSDEHLLPHPRAAGMHRREQGWSGEWRGNVGNMEDVVRSLRGLKLK